MNTDAMRVLAAVLADRGGTPQAQDVFAATLSAAMHRDGQWTQTDQRKWFEVWERTKADVRDV